MVSNQMPPKNLEPKEMSENMTTLGAGVLSYTTVKTKQKRQLNVSKQESALRDESRSGCLGQVGSVYKMVMNDRRSMTRHAA